MTNELVSLDVETTGISKVNNHIIQLAAIRFNVETGQIITKKSWYVKPKDPKFVIEQSAFDIHGITREFVLEHGITLDKVWKELQPILEGCDILTYNGNTYDICFLYQDLKEYNIEMDYSVKCYDAFSVECSFNSRTLQDIYKKYMGKDFENAHDACADALATIDVFRKQLQIYGEEKVESVENEVISPEHLIVRDSNGNVVFAHGKYAHIPTNDIVKRDPNYIAWIFKNSSKQTRETIKNEYLKFVKINQKHEK